MNEVARMLDRKLEELVTTWHGRHLWARAYEAPGGPLVGMGLLRGSQLEIDVVRSGSVVVEELS